VGLRSQATANIYGILDLSVNFFLIIDL